MKCYDCGAKAQNQEKEPLCDDCLSQRQDEATRCYEFGSIKDVYIFDDVIGEYPDCIKAQKWVKTDGWRGYTDYELNEGYIDYSGWVTSIADEYTKRKIELSELFDKLNKELIIPPVEIYWLFGQTSNVFSQVSKIIIKESDKEAFQNWLISLDTNAHNLIYQLS